MHGLAQRRRTCRQQRVPQSRTTSRRLHQEIREVEKKIIQIDNFEIRQPVFDDKLDLSAQVPFDTGRTLHRNHITRLHG